MARSSGSPGAGDYIWPVQCQICGCVYNAYAVDIDEFEMLEDGWPMQACPECGAYLVRSLYAISDEEKARLFGD